MTQNIKEIDLDIMLQLISYFIYNFKVVQEYERAVIFRLGRLMQGGAKGPGKQFHFLLYI